MANNSKDTPAVRYPEIIIISLKQIKVQIEDTQKVPTSDTGSDIFFATSSLRVII